MEAFVCVCVFMLACVSVHECVQAYVGACMRACVRLGAGVRCITQVTDHSVFLVQVTAGALSDHREKREHVH